MRVNISGRLQGPWARGTGGCRTSTGWRTRRRARMATALWAGLYRGLRFNRRSARMIGPKGIRRLPGGCQAAAGPLPGWRRSEPLQG
jgi:hypothetical protein